MAINIDNLQFKILDETVNIRSSANKEAKISGITYRGLVVTATQQSDDGNWYYVPAYDGWIAAETISYTEESSVDEQEILRSSEAINTINDSLMGTGEADTTANGVNGFLTDNLSGIFGIPYQFMEIVDRPIDGTMFGRKYAEKIVGRLPVLFLTPGRPEFLKNYDNGEAAGIIMDLVDGNGQISNAASSDSGKFYTMEFDYDNYYYNYVNPMCRAVAQLMGIGGTAVNINGHYANLSLFDWHQAANKNFASYFGTGSNVTFYVDGLNSISESFSNDTRESSLAGTVNGLSDTAKEIGFLIGYDNAAKISAASGEAYDATLGQITSLVNDMTKGGGIITNMLNGENVNALLQGGKMIFPEMWSDSSFSKSYSIDFKLRSPDCDPLSVYLNIMVPYIHLLAMVLPHSEPNAPNVYTSPFLVRAFYKGIFNIDMGIITDMSVSKGKEGAWTDDGIPTEMDVSITIKDLYSNLVATSSQHLNQLVNNTALMDYLANLAGINLAQDEITRKLEIYSILAAGRVTSSPGKLFSGLEQYIANQLKKLY